MYNLNDYVNSNSGEVNGCIIEIAKDYDHSELYCVQWPNKSTDWYRAKDLEVRV